ncbi:uncharacterized protein MONOS_7221 [Monocercomonoides exilis]|uniref:uncharacterized protein n=1 Tax=Monocercomonoides exilis TaxID=2049356 RepID=UPI0035596F82|nr:hypothetical protein MONOS_7221 [Monocercomonoides exilis]|eukprot:MONOS_7221.1-p1 / transcript=MONOS_7221.1 / gene=MONOS_7221 / organism=Monocercomonoides_exilis_PA203 / gene_product=unspecified product / transcript_product=unspecified product / location=Mono_scaffold00241:59663-60553(-) / protein_length=148 / sequence_SO=supercontig / SO=protein_coding / is_pseudo=false
MDGRLAGEREKEEEEEEEEGDGDDGDEMRNEEEVNKDDLCADANVEKVIAIGRGIGTVTSGGSEKEEIEEEGDEEEGEEEEDMFDKEAELGLVMSKDFCVSEKESVAGDDEVNGFGEVPTRTEGADNCECCKGEKGGEANVEEAVMC